MAVAKLELFQALTSLFYPPVCTVCSASIGVGEYLCDDCQANAPRISPPFCARCSEPFSGAIIGPFECANCAHRRLYFEAAVAVYRSRGIVRHVVHQFKYGREMHLRYPIAEWLWRALEDERLHSREFDVIVPVPLHPARQRERGFNQAALLASLLGERISAFVKPVLRRIRYTTTQTAFDRSERMENLRGAFRLRRKADVRGCRVLLVDDVLTTGATLSECARVLKKAGAASIYAATAARA
jgi:competence protein ComFC